MQNNTIIVLDRKVNAYMGPAEISLVIREGRGQGNIYFFVVIKTG